MYIPKAFEENNKEKQIEFIKQYNFATLITANGDIEVSHLPMYFQAINGKDYLFCHLAKANNHSQSIEGQALAVFNGPHAYVSEKWYAAPNVVPTWNYAVVHVAGVIKVTSEQELKQIIEMMVKSHEGDYQAFQKNIDDKLFSDLISQIIGIKMEIKKIEGKSKLSQNKSIADQTRIANQLAKQNDFNSHLVADLMNKNIQGKTNGSK